MFTTKSTFPSVMYHYVRDLPNTEFPEIRGILTSKFEEQIIFLKKHFSFITVNDYAEFVQGKKILKPNSIMLTFDDGLKDHYTNVFPILKKHNIKATLYPLTNPITKKIVQPVQKVHFLFAKIGDDKFREEYNMILKTDFGKFFDKYEVNDKEIPGVNYRWDPPKVKNLKYMIGIMPDDLKNKILNKIFPLHFDDEKSFSEELYLNKEEIKEMSEDGQEFGSHTLSHPILSSLNEEMQKEEIYESKKIIEKILNKKINSFCYPYGKYNETTLKLVKNASYTNGIIVNPEDNTKSTNLFEINRYDCNDIKPED